MATSDARSRIGFPAKDLICDECGFTAEFVAERGKPGDGQARTKAQKKGWSYIKSTDRCPTCEHSRKGLTDMKQERRITSDTPPRQPTRDEKRAIMDMLKEIYDVDAGRYKGGETDKTIAETLEGGIMPGWVAQLREEFFGPDGGNDEMERLVNELRESQAKLDTKAKELHDGIQEQLKELRELNQGRESSAKLLKRVEKIKAAVGPRAERV